MIFKELLQMFLLFALILQGSSLDDSLKMIAHLIYVHNYPTNFVAFSCNKFDFIEAQKHFSQKGISSVFIETPAKLHQLKLISPLTLMMNLQCEYTLEIISEIKKMYLFPYPNKWFLISDSSESEEHINKIPLLLDNDVLLLTKTRENNYDLKKIYKISHNSQMSSTENNIWQPTAELIGGYSERHTNKTSLSKFMLNVCIVITNNETFHHLRDKRDKHIDTITKVNIILVDHLGDFINATFNFSIESTWGYRGNNSEWTGMMGELTRKKVEIGGTPFFFTADRVSEIDYIAMTSQTKSKFVFREPKLSYVSNVYVLPFHWSVWISSVVLVLTTTITLYFTVRWESYHLAFRNPRKVDASLEGKLSDVVFLSVGAVCQQGTAVIPKNPSGRIITILTFLSLMFLYTSYSANIVALLQSSSNSIRTLRDLLNSRLELGVDDTVFNNFYFKNASEPVRRAIYMQKVAPPGQKPRFYPIEYGVKRVRQGLFAFHMESGAGYKIVSDTFQEHEKCDLYEIEYLQVPDPWMAVQKNTTYKELIKIGLRLIHESGLQEREVDLLYTKKPRCSSRGNSFISVGIVDCYFAAVVYASGIALAAFVYFLEISVKKIFKNA